MGYEAIKEIATMFYIKCSKYPKEMLTQEFRDVLFDEVIEECIAMDIINSSMADELTNKDVL